jgi:GlpG protein
MSMDALYAGLRRLPVTSALLLLSALGFLVIWLNLPVAWVARLTFVPFDLQGGVPRFGVVTGEPWRFITPAFLHFSWLHIVFNALWTWEFGRRIELTLGSRVLLLLFLVIALVSNSAQYIAGGVGIFGGMSGVVYGLLGFLWIAPRLQPRWQFFLPPGLVVFMLGWLVVCLVGLVEVLGFGAIANAAHVGGLLAGMVLGALAGAWSVRLGRG